MNRRAPLQGLETPQHCLTFPSTAPCCTAGIALFLLRGSELPPCPQEAWVAAMWNAELPVVWRTLRLGELMEGSSQPRESGLCT